MLYGGVEDRQIEEYLPMVCKIVNQIDLSSYTVIDRDDLISVGLMGLVDAMGRYDPSQNNSFGNYARLRVKGAIYDELRRVGIVQPPQLKEVKRYSKCEQELEKKLMRLPSEEEICREMEINLNDLKKIYDAIHILSTMSLEVLFSEKLLDSYSDGKEATAISMVEKSELYDYLGRVISKLEGRKQLILQLYYLEELSIVNIAEILSLSRPRVSQLHRQALFELKKYLEEEGVVIG